MSEKTNGTGEKDRFVEKMRWELEEVESDIDELREMASEGTTEVRDRWKALLRRIERKRNALRSQLRELRQSSSEAWEAVKASAEDAWSDLMETCAEVRKKLH